MVGKRDKIAVLLLQESLAVEYMYIYIYTYTYMYPSLGPPVLAALQEGVFLGCTTAPNRSLEIFHCHHGKHLHRKVSAPLALCNDIMHGGFSLDSGKCRSDSRGHSYSGEHIKIAVPRHTWFAS